MKYLVSFGLHTSRKPGMSLVRIRVSWSGGVYRTHTGWSLPTEKWDRYKRMPRFRRCDVDLERMAGLI